jgi:heterodisulfide reductase subunit A-like polyferredoxin
LERRIEVYICHCGLNIAATLDPLDIADAGFKVYLVEREPSIGGLSLHNSISPFVAKKKISILQRTSNLKSTIF